MRLIVARLAVAEKRLIRRKSQHLAERHLVLASFEHKHAAVPKYAEALGESLGYLVVPSAPEPALLDSHIAPLARPHEMRWVEHDQPEGTVCMGDVREVDQLVRANVEGPSVA